PGAKVKSIKIIQSLWGGYGNLYRVFLFTESAAVKNSIVVKHIVPPKSSGISHDRKVKSYDVERAFYDFYASKLDH
ncbi:MAG: choline kinase, partial [Flammeovirgaceae bacterium]